MTEVYIRMIRDKQPPKTGKKVASLLGFIGYYHELVPTFPRLIEAMNGVCNKRQLGPEDWTN